MHNVLRFDKFWFHKQRQSSLMKRSEIEGSLDRGGLTTKGFSIFQKCVLFIVLVRKKELK